MKLIVSVPIGKVYDPIQIVEDFSLAIKTEMQRLIADGEDQPLKGFSNMYTSHKDIFPLYLIWDPELKNFQRKLLGLIETNPSVEDEVRDIAQTIGLQLPYMDDNEPASKTF